MHMAVAALGAFSPLARKQPCLCGVSRILRSCALTRGLTAGRREEAIRWNMPTYRLASMRTSRDGLIILNITARLH